MAAQAAAKSAMESHFNAVDESQFEPGGALHFDQAQAQVNPAEVLVKVCVLYRTIRPFLNFASIFFLVPGKVKRVITAHMDLMDGLCPKS